jgi:hypothetical protein
MDIGTLVSWIQVVIWVVAVGLWLGRIARGEKTMPLWLKRAFSSNGLVGIVIVLGLIMSGISLYMSHSASAIPDSITLNISAYNPPYPSPMRVVSDQTFEDQQVPLDGIVYQRCTFVNVCFLYSGNAYNLQDSTVKKHWKVCVRDGPLDNYSKLLGALDMLSPKVQHIEKTIVSQ